jgi:hypothetical protein
MITWLLILILVMIVYYSETPQFLHNPSLLNSTQKGGYAGLIDSEVADYPFYGQGPYVWPPLLKAMGRPYQWLLPDQMGFPVRWIGNDPALPLPLPSTI